VWCIELWHVAVAIVNLVKSGMGDNDKPFRPTITNASMTNTSNDQVQRCMMMMMTECWMEKQYARPSFDVCLDVIYALTGDKYVTLVHRSSIHRCF